MIKIVCPISQKTIYDLASGENPINDLVNVVVNNPGCGTAVINEAMDVGFTPEAQGQLEKEINNLNNSSRRNLVELGRGLIKKAKGLFRRV